MFGTISVTISVKLSYSNSLVFILQISPVQNPRVKKWNLFENHPRCYRLNGYKHYFDFCALCFPAFFKLLPQLPASCIFVMKPIHLIAHCRLFRGL